MWQIPTRAAQTFTYRIVTQCFSGDAEPHVNSLKFDEISTIDLWLVQLVNMYFTFTRRLLSVRVSKRKRKRIWITVDFIETGEWWDSEESRGMTSPDSFRSIFMTNWSSRCVPLWKAASWCHRNRPVHQSSMHCMHHRSYDRTTLTPFVAAFRRQFIEKL
jgi:hypothetical protein